MSEDTPTPRSDSPLVLITGAAGNLGHSLAADLGRDHRVVGLDRDAGGADFPIVAFDLSSGDKVRRALREVADRFGTRIAAVVHLAAYFDATGKPNPLYDVVNVQGTRRLLDALQPFEVGRFVYAGTMLVHAPCKPGERIDEDQPFDPPYAYPQSKLQTEQVIREHHGRIPYAILRLAGIYDRETMVPTLAHQIARIHERDLESHLYSGSLLTGQSMLHREDMVAAFRRTIAARDALPDGVAMLIGEADAIGYETLQDRIGELIHGRDEWPTLRVPKRIAALGSWAQAKVEPIVPDALDQGERPFIRPYMVRMADAHYALDTSRAKALIGWEARHALADELPGMIDALKQDPKRWYDANGVVAPPWLEDADRRVDDPEGLRARTERRIRAEHAQHRWAHILNIGLGFWLLTQPLLIQVREPPLRVAEMALGLGVIVFATLSLGWQLGFARWVTAALGALTMAVPFVFYTGNAAAYLSDTLVGALIFGFAICLPPEPGTAMLARMTGPEIPPGWSFNPSSWIQRIPIIALAFVGLFVSRYLAAYQMGHVDTIWEPFFAGAADNPLNGSEEIVTSSVSQAWPVPDAALGGYTYVLEILTGLVGSRARWRTMPWLVLLFGLMIVPLGIVSITFIIIQPIVIGTWSTLALVGAAAMLVQIPYSIDELVAVGTFLRRRAAAGQSVLRTFLFGDTDEAPTAPSTAPRDATDAPRDAFDRPPRVVLADMLSGGVNLPWTLAIAIAIGVLLMCSRLTVGASGGIANADHVIGSLVLTVVALAAAEPLRALRFLLMPLGAALCIVPMVYGIGGVHLALDIACGLALIALSLPRGRIEQRYGRWSRFVF
ncbi:MAG: NAD-dependent epimerase/dehydratase family protein [Lautropia sp.]